MAYKGHEAIWEAAKQLDSDLSCMSWDGYTVCGSHDSCEAVRHLIHQADRLTWFEKEYAREHPPFPPFNVKKPNP